MLHMSEIEEANKCSGMDEDADKPFPIYLFSSIGNGVPDSSCHVFVVEEIKTNLDSLRIGMIVMMVPEFGFILLIIIVLLIKVKECICPK